MTAPNPFRLYLAGPAELDSLALTFDAAEAELTEAGFDVVNPRPGRPAGATWARNLRRCVGLLVTCDGVVSLPGWQSSPHARTEVKLAHDVELPVMALHVWRDHRAAVLDSLKAEAAAKSKPAVDLRRNAGVR